MTKNHVLNVDFHDQRKNVIHFYPCARIVDAGLASAGEPCFRFEVVCKCRFTRQLVVRVLVRVSVATSRVLISPIEKDPMLFLHSQNFLPKSAMHF